MIHRRVDTAGGAVNAVIVNKRRRKGEEAMEVRRSQSGVVGVGVLVTVGVLGALAVGLLGFYAYASSVRNQALAWETDLNKAVRIEVSERATYATSVPEQLGVANLKGGKMKEIIVAAMEGRYGDNPQQGNALLQMVTEAYPGTEGLNIYDKILPAIQAGREAIRNKQNLRIEKAQAYNYWRKEGILRAWILSGIYPSRDLTFKIGDNNYSASDALEKMAEPISTESVNKTFETGIEKPLEIR